MKWLFEENIIKYLSDDGKLLGKLEYIETNNGDIDIEHVFVDDSMRGQGLAGIIMQQMVEFLRKNNKKAFASCSYANSWLHKNKKDVEDIISDNLNDLMACKINKDK